MVTVFERVENLIGRFSVTVAIIGGTGLLFATIVTCISILLKLGRRAIDAFFGASTAPAALDWVRPILGEEELVQYGVGFALFAALPYVMFKRGHVSIDLFERAFGARGNRVLELLGDLTFAVIAYLLMTRQWFLIFKKARGDDPLWFEALLTGQWGEIADRLRDSQESQILGIKLWPTYIAAELCVIAFFIVAVFCVVRSARALFRSGVTHA